MINQVIYVHFCCQNFILMALHITSFGKIRIYTEPILSMSHYTYVHIYVEAVS